MTHEAMDPTPPPSFDARPAQVNPGDDLIVRLPGLLALVRRANASDETVNELLECLRTVSATAAGTPGTRLARQLSIWLSGAGTPPTFGTVAATEDGVAIFLHGPVQVSDADGSVSFSGTDAAFAVDRVLPAPDDDLLLAAEDAPAADSGPSRLPSWAGLQAGVVVGGSVTLGSRAAAARIPSNQPPPAEVPDAVLSESGAFLPAAVQDAADAAEPMSATPMAAEPTPEVAPLTDPAAAAQMAQPAASTAGEAPASMAPAAPVEQAPPATTTPMADAPSTPMQDAAAAMRAEPMPPADMDPSVEAMPSAEPMDSTEPMKPAEPMESAVPEPAAPQSAPPMPAPSPREAPATNLEHPAQPGAASGPPTPAPEPQGPPAPRPGGVGWVNEQIHGTAPEAQRAPLPVAGQAAAPSLRQRQEEAEKGAAERPGAYVKGFRCSRGHLNDPRVSFCRLCGIRMDQLTGILTFERRPPLGLIVLDAGTSFVLDDNYLVGRTPQGSEEVQSGRYRPIQIDDRSGSLSRVHAEIRLEDWDVLLIDRHSANGTFVAGPDGAGGHLPWTRLAPGQQFVLTPGTQVQLGRRRFVFESSAAHI